eukprot:CAMPEP_0118888054 /NCGR_PEP_ID=MMETSP1163-20130328/25527_1 /TAXON_ID=124430 /ORGANISM="Phaeomonas parva, Strain CCMP2877" /LENGTH=101 /DNA_ID=CAMNT_0006826617 /DNA_START=551 /DNA_END=856 /DNA_ORIENTATION=+
MNVPTRPHGVDNPQQEAAPEGGTIHGEGSLEVEADAPGSSTTDAPESSAADKDKAEGAGAGVVGDVEGEGAVEKKAREEEVVGGVETGTQHGPTVSVDGPP